MLPVYSSSVVTGTPSALARRLSTGSDGFFRTLLSSWDAYASVTLVRLLVSRWVSALDSRSLVKTTLNLSLCGDDLTICQVSVNSELHLWNGWQPDQLPK